MASTKLKLLSHKITLPDERTNDQFKEIIQLQKEPPKQPLRIPANENFFGHALKLGHNLRDMYSDEKAYKDLKMIQIDKVDRSVKPIQNDKFVPNEDDDKCSFSPAGSNYQSSEHQEYESSKSESQEDQQLSIVQNPNKCVKAKDIRANKPCLAIISLDDDLEYIKVYRLNYREMNIKLSKQQDLNQDLILLLRLDNVPNDYVSWRCCLKALLSQRIITDESTPELLHLAQRSIGEPNAAELLVRYVKEFFGQLATN